MKKGDIVRYRYNPYRIPSYSDLLYVLYTSPHNKNEVVVINIEGGYHFCGTMKIDDLQLVTDILREEE
jgi:uncharacterized Fe-S cluster-containing protein